MDNVNLSAADTVVSSAGGRENKNQYGKHLYVFQDTEGLLKIGRSNHPKKRRRTVESASGRKLAIVIIVLNRGSDERSIMDAARSHRTLGEWFSGSLECRAIIESAIGVPIKWPRSVGAIWKDGPTERDEAKRRAWVESVVAAACAKIEAQGVVRRRIREFNKARKERKRLAQMARLGLAVSP